MSWFLPGQIFRPGVQRPAVEAFPIIRPHPTASPGRAPMMARARVVIVLVVLVLKPLLHAAAPPTMTGVDRYGDPLPRGAIARLGTVRLRHDLNARDSASPLIFLADGRSLVSRGKSDLRLWDVQTDRLLSWMIPGIQPSTARLLPDGRTLVTATWEDAPGDGTGGVKRWCVERWQWGKRLRLERRYLQPVIDSRGEHDCLFSPDGKWLVSGRHKGRLILWETATGQQVCQLDFSNSHVNYLTFTPDGRQLIVLTS